MIVKFKKEHVAGFLKGDVKDVDDRLAKRLIESGHVEESTKEALSSYKKKQSKVVAPDLYKEAKESANHSRTKCTKCGDNPKCEGCNEKDEQFQKVYHVLTEEDIDANMEAASDCAVGDEVEENEEGELVLDGEGKLIKRELGNV